MSKRTSDKKIKTLSNSIMYLINKKNRVDRLLLIKTVDELIYNKKKKDKILNLDLLERKISEGLSEHLETCSYDEPCFKEKAIDIVFTYLDTRKREIINTKTFWENITTNPVGIGIFVIATLSIILTALKVMQG